MSNQMPSPGGSPDDNQPADPDAGATSAASPTSTASQPSALNRRNGVLALSVAVALVIGYLVSNLGGSTETVPAAAAVPSAASATATAPSVAPDAPTRSDTPTRSAAPTSSAAPLAQGAVAPSPPVRIEIPAIGVDDDFIDLGLNDDGTLEVPQDYQQVGWYADGAKPGDTNYPPAIIAGHVDSFEGPAVFYDLGKLVIGDQIRITQADGTVAVYVMYAESRFPKSEFPADTVYAERPESEIVLITCTGGFDQDARSYVDNLVVSAKLDPALSTVGG